MQYVFSGEAPFGHHNVTIPSPSQPSYCFHDVWDARQARFERCFLGVIALIPTGFAAAILLAQVLRLGISWRPRLTRPFVEEAPPGNDDLEYDVKSRLHWNLMIIVLGVLSSLGFLFQLASLALVLRDRSIPLPAASMVVPWLVTLSIIVIQRPGTAPISILAICCVYVVCTAIDLASYPHWPLTVRESLDVATLVTAVLSVLTVLNMPLRDPLLCKKDICSPGSEPTSTLRSPEDDMTVLQFMTVSWISPLINVGSKRQLQEEDVWSLALEFQHSRLHQAFRQLKGSVVQRLLKANGIDLLILTLLGILELCANYASPILLQYLLKAMEDHKAPKRAAVTYAAITLAVRLISTQSSVFSLWFGRRCYERSRGEMITMLYEKTLGRKIGFKPTSEEKSEGEVICNEIGHEDLGAVPSKGTTPSRFMRVWQSVSGFFRRVKIPEKPNEPASMGKILNLMRNDVYEVAQRFWEFQQLITKPLSVVFSITLVVRFLGWSSLIAVSAVLIAQVLNSLLARVLIYYEKKRRAATDEKLQVITQFIEAIRHLRWYGWQSAWLKQIMAARQKELNLRIVTGLWNVLIAFVNTSALDLTPVIAFFAYTVIAKEPLTVDIAFPAMQLFQLMTSALRDIPQLIITLLNAYVAVGRLEDFMAEPDRDQKATEALIGDSLAFQHASFAWPGLKNSVLKDVDLSIPQGLTVVCGEVGSGKTALLQALLGELDLLSGQLIAPPQEPVGYCAQTPWLQSMNVRDNILFSAPYDEKRYKSVLDACALTPDLAEFKAGDLSLIGESGIGLSGGQKARVALARAVYSTAKILLLDDPLSALDQQTAEKIVQKLFAGPLLQGRTIVLVTHRTDLVLGLTTQMIQIDNGTATILDHEATASGTLRRTRTAQSESKPGEEAVKKQQAAAVPDKFIEDEHRAHGGVKASVYWEYIKAGKLYWWALLVTVLALYRLSDTGLSWFLKSWGEAYNTRSSLTLSVVQDSDILGTYISGPFDGLPPPEDNIRPWLLGLFLLSFSKSITYVLSQGTMLVIVYVAGKGMFEAVMERVAFATFRFYDITPVGRLMNRMTSDISVIDGNISAQFQIVTWLGISWVTSVIVIASVTPTFLVFSALLAMAFVLIFRRFLPTSQSLRRLEMVSLSPLMSNFGALLNGLATVRAFHAQPRFQDRVIEVVDTFQKMDHFYWSLQGWLMYRYDSLGAVATFLITMIALGTNVSAGLTAFVLLNANRFVITTHYLCKQYGQLQMEFVSVERVSELLHLEQEPKGDVSPPAWWPSFSGDITLEKATFRYAPNLDPALSDISFTIKGGSKTAVIGRTGSGKSTLALALLATVVPESGRILIDNIDLAEVDKQLLRTRVTFLAQDPVLFPGTMRENLDPVSEHSDEDCAAILERVCSRQGWSLTTDIEAGGHNLSQGQRQLVGLARAVLRRSAIIIMDEATASIDQDTAMQIQQILHEEMMESTVVTIAHRLEAVKNADYCIVLGKGRVLEQGPAGEMLRKRGAGRDRNDDDQDKDDEA